MALMKTCKKCGNSKESGLMHKSRRLCLDCYKVYERDRTRHRRKIDPAKFRDQAIRRYASSVEQHRAYRLQSKFGMSLAEYHSWVATIGNQCEICKRPPKDRALDIDHDHISGQVRGLLCNQCNQGLGLLKDDPELLEKAAQYLRERKKV